MTPLSHDKIPSAPFIGGKKYAEQANPGSARHKLFTARRNTEVSLTIPNQQKIEKVSGLRGNKKPLFVHNMQFFYRENKIDGKSNTSYFQVT